MTITLSWWMLIPLALILAACWLFYDGEQEAGMFGGVFHAIAGIALLAGALMFMLGRWLA